MAMSTRTRLCLLPMIIVLSLVSTYSGSAQEPKTTTSSYFPRGSYTGSVRIEKLHECEEFAWKRRNRPPGPSWTSAYLTVANDQATLTIEYPPGANTIAKDYFETKEQTLKLVGERMIGGVRHRSGYYFDVTFKIDPAEGGYVGTGTWIIQGQCEAVAPRYPVRIVLRPPAGTRLPTRVQEKASGLPSKNSRRLREVAGARADDRP